MKKILALAAIGMGLAACQTTNDVSTSDAASGRQLATQSDMNAVVGRTITLNPGQSFVISADGTLNGTWDGQPLVGTYEMRDGYFCRTLSQGPRGPAPEDCQLFVLQGNQLMGTRDRGNGSSFTYTVS